MALCLLLPALASGISGCARKARPYTAKDAVDALSAISQQIKTERGRAWINVRSRIGDTDQKISFPANIVVDRTDPKGSQLRIEAMDPFGATHALMILEKGKRLTWVDFDQKRIFTMRDTWNGLPLARLPELLLGLGALPEDGRVGAADADGFEVRSGSNVFKFLMTWIDPGPRLALEGIDGSVKGDKYSVRNSKYLDTKDFYLPEDIKIVGYPAGAVDPHLDIHVAWRERSWNEEIPAQVFQPPKKVLQEFKRN